MSRRSLEARGKRAERAEDIAIAVFNTGFREQLSSSERLVHLAAIVLVTIAIILVLAPAAVHRVAEPMSVSRRFNVVSGRLLVASMAPLALGSCLDVYLVARIIIGTRGSAAIVAGSLLVVFIAFWFALPGYMGLSRGRRRAS